MKLLIQEELDRANALAQEANASDDVAGPATHEGDVERVLADAPPSPAPKRRGRPPKSPEEKAKTKAKAKARAKAAKAKPAKPAKAPAKRRGRPPKAEAKPAKGKRKFLVKVPAAKPESNVLGGAVGEVLRLVEAGHTLGSIEKAVGTLRTLASKLG